MNCGPLPFLLRIALVGVVLVAVYKVYQFPGLISKTFEYQMNGRQVLIRSCAGSQAQDTALRTQTALIKNQLQKEFPSLRIGLHLANPVMLSVVGADDRTGQALANRWHQLLEAYSVDCGSCEVGVYDATERQE